MTVSELTKAIDFLKNKNWAKCEFELIEIVYNVVMEYESEDEQK
jgi:hypothetical protein